MTVSVKLISFNFIRLMQSNQTIFSSSQRICKVVAKNITGTIIQK